MKHLLPLYIMHQPATDDFSIFDSNDDVVCIYMTKEQAEFLVTAANAHYPMLEALEEFVSIYPGNRGIKKARAAIAQAKP